MHRASESKDQTLKKIITFLGGRFGFFFFSCSGAGERGRRPRRRPGGAGLNRK